MAHSNQESNGHVGTDLVLADADFSQYEADIAQDGAAEVQDDAAEVQPELTLAQVDLKNDTAVCAYADGLAARKLKAAREKAAAYRKIEKANALMEACDSDLDELKRQPISNRAMAWVKAAHNETKPTPPSKAKKAGA